MQNVRQTTCRGGLWNWWRAGPEGCSGSGEQHSDWFRKAARVLFSFNCFTIQSQQIQDVYASKSRMVAKIIAQRGSAPRRAEQILKPHHVTKKNSVLIGSCDISTTSGYILIWPKKYHWRNRITRKLSWKIWDFFCIAIKLYTALYPAASTGSRFRSPVSLATS